MEPLGQTRTFKPGSLVIPVSTSNWVKATRFQNFALAIGLQTWMLLQPRRVRVDGKLKKLVQGGYVVCLENSPVEEYSKKILTTLAHLLRIRVIRTQETLTVNVLKLSRPTVGVLSDAGSPYAFYDILSSTGFQCIPVSSKQIRTGDLHGFDVIVIPGGGEKGPPFKSSALGDDGRRNLEFCQEGGAVWGSCGSDESGKGLGR